MHSSSYAIALAALAGLTATTFPFTSASPIQPEVAAHLLEKRAGGPAIQPITGPCYLQYPLVVDEMSAGAGPAPPSMGPGEGGAPPARTTISKGDTEATSPEEGDQGSSASPSLEVIPAQTMTSYAPAVLLDPSMPSTPAGAVMIYSWDMPASVGEQQNATALWTQCIDQCNGLTGCQAAYLGYNVPSTAKYGLPEGYSLGIGCRMFNATLLDTDLVQVQGGNYTQAVTANIVGCDRTAIPATAALPVDDGEDQNVLADPPAPEPTASSATEGVSQGEGEEGIAARQPL